MRSLQARLSIGLVISLILVFFFQWLLVSNAIYYLNEAYIVNRLEQDSETILASINFDSAGKLQLDSNRIAPAYQRPFSGFYFKIQSKHETIRSRSLWDEDISFQQLGIGTSRKSNFEGPQKQPLIALNYGYKKQNREITIAVAEDLSHIKNVMVTFNMYYGVISLIILVALILLQTFVLKRGFVPLQKIQSEMELLSRGEIAQLDANVPREVVPLVTEINRLLILLVNRLKRSRNALSNLAHALKTPLTVLMHLGKDTSNSSTTDLVNTVQKHSEIMNRLMQRVLKRARLAGKGTSTAYFKVSEEIPSLLEALHLMYQHKSIKAESHIDENLRILIDREDMLELLGNLLDNAFKWAVGHVSLHLHKSDTYLIVVEDDGPGVPEDEIFKLTHRGVRLDESASGQGLGLSIVQEIVDLYQGSFKIMRSENLGGFCARINLPCKLVD